VASNAHASRETIRELERWAVLLKRASREMTKIIFAPPPHYTCVAAAQNLGWAKDVVTNVFEFIRLAHPEASQPK
jgi:hypothetical protein